MALKDRVLQELINNKGKSISGEEIANNLGVSRNGVWKAVGALKASGLDIITHQNKGYELNENAVCESEISPFVPDGIELFFYNSVDSTNTVAKRLAAGGFKKNALFIADEQTAGRGRLGRSFYSPKGTGIYLSYLFHPENSIADTVFITTAAAVAVVRAVERVSSAKPVIKWVNDVYLNGKKMCGILTEGISDFESGKVESAVVGIGINFSTKDFPRELSDVAVSLDDKNVTRLNLLLALADEIIKASKDLNDKSIIEDYRNHSFVIGKKIEYIKKNQKYYATALAVDDKGGLLVENEDGTKHVLNTGEISLKTV